VKTNDFLWPLLTGELLSRQHKPLFAASINVFLVVISGLSRMSHL
jgi:hypothetical protein